MANDKHEPGFSVYENRSGLNLTWNREDGGHTSVHSNSKTTGESVISEKTADSLHYQRIHDSDGYVIRETLKEED